MTEASRGQRAARMRAPARAVRRCSARYSVDDASAHVGGLDAPAAAWLPSATAKAIVGVVGGRVADEPAVAEVAVVGLRRTACRSCRRPRPAESGWPRLSWNVALGGADAGGQLHHRPTSRAVVGGRPRAAGAARPAAPAARPSARRRRARSSVGAGISPWLAIVGRQQRAVHGRQRRVPEAGRGARELQRRRRARPGATARRAASKGIASPKPKACADARRARRRSGGALAELGEDRVLRLAEAVGQRVAAADRCAGMSTRLSGRIDETPPW